jgi:hypothetical protein
MVHVLGLPEEGREAEIKDLDLLTQAFVDDGINARLALLDGDNYTEGVRTATQVLRSTFFRPNILFLRLYPDSDLAELQTLVDRTAAYRMGIVLLARHPVIELGRERLINVWVSPQGPDWELDLRQSNLDLAILLAYKLTRNWGGRINLCMSVQDEEQQAVAEAYLDDLRTLTRLPGETEVLVWQDSFADALRRAPRADLSSFGLPRDPDLAFSQQIVEMVDGSCIFVRDSGDESALA